MLLLYSWAHQQLLRNVPKRQIWICKARWVWGSAFLPRQCCYKWASLRAERACLFPGSSSLPATCCLSNPTLSCSSLNLELIQLVRDGMGLSISISQSVLSTWPSTGGWLWRSASWVSSCPMELMGPRVRNHGESPYNVWYGRACVGAQGLWK